MLPRCNTKLKNSALELILEGFGVTVVSFCAPNETPEAVLPKVEIMMANRFRQQQKAGGWRARG